jgi:hypothetical protein
MNMMLHMIDENILWQRVVRDIRQLVKTNQVGILREKLQSLTLVLDVTRLDMESLEVYLPSALSNLLELCVEVSAHFDVRKRLTMA